MFVIYNIARGRRRRAPIRAKEGKAERLKRGKPGGRASGIWKKENGKPEAAFSVLELVCGRTAATVNPLGKRINNESRARALGIGGKEKSGR